MILIDREISERYAQFTVVEISDYYFNPNPGWELVMAFPSGVDRHRPMVMLGLPKDSVFSEMTDELKSLRRELSEEEGRSQEHWRELKAAEAKIESLTKARDALDEVVSRLTEANQKLEPIIGKLRAHYGEAAIREVVGESQIGEELSR